MIKAHLLHPIFNHLTIGLFLVLIIAEVRLFFKTQKNKNELLSLLWIIYCPAVLLSISFGLLSKEILFKTDVHEAVNFHENLGLIFLILSGICGYLKLKLIKNKNLTSPLFLTMMTVTFFVLIYLGSTGGELVFSSGIGVKL